MTVSVYICLSLFIILIASSWLAVSGDRCDKLNHLALCLLSLLKTYNLFSLEETKAAGLIPKNILFGHKCKMLDWMKHKLESRLLGEIPITSDMQMIYPLYSRKWRTKEPLDERERGEWKGWLKTQHSKNQDHGIRIHHFMANGKQWKTLFSWAPKSLQMVMAVMKLKGACSLEEKLWQT